VIDVKSQVPGHVYELPVFDSSVESDTSLLVFMERVGKEYPGNTETRSGTNLQSVLRACWRRIDYLQGQKHCAENLIMKFLLTCCIWLLEFRAARRHGLAYLKLLSFARNAPMCGRCGHTVCAHCNQGNYETTDG